MEGGSKGCSSDSLNGLSPGRRLAQDEASRPQAQLHRHGAHPARLAARGGGLAARVFESLDITVEEVRAQVARSIVGQGDEVTTGQIPFTPRAKKVLEPALREALSLGHNYIGTEHILLGLVRENEGVAARILLDFDADAEKIRNEIIRMLSGLAGGAQVPEGALGEKAASSKLLDQFGRNLTKAATDGKLTLSSGARPRSSA